MLIEIWERLRGYDKWIQTEATIKSSDLEDLGFGSFRTFRNDKSCRMGLNDQWQSKCLISWTDASGIPRTGSYAVSERSPLFHLYEGKTVSIRYNPACPEKYYLRELFWHKATFRVCAWAVLLFCVAGLAVNLVVYSIGLWRHLQ